MKLTLGRKLARYVKYQRAKRHLTIAQLAEAADLTPSYISRLEQGDYDSPTLEVIDRLAQALQMPLLVFLAKSQIIEYEKDLPDLPYYLHEKYSFPQQAIGDIELFLSFIKKKYRQEIKLFKRATRKYWRKH